MNETPQKPHHPIGAYIASLIIAGHAIWGLVIVLIHHWKHPGPLIAFNIAQLLVALFIVRLSQIARVVTLIEAWGLFAAVVYAEFRLITWHVPTDMAVKARELMIGAIPRLLWAVLSCLAVIYFLQFDKATVGAFRNAGRKVIGDGH